MKKFYVAYWENLQRKEMIVEAKGKIQAERKFRELKGNFVIIQLKEVTENQRSPYGEYTYKLSPWRGVGAALENSKALTIAKIKRKGMKNL